MKLYKVSVRTKEWEHQGYSYHASKAAAQKVIRDAPDHECELEVIQVGRTKSEIIKALNRHGAHPDNG